MLPLDDQSLMDELGMPVDECDVLPSPKQPLPLEFSKSLLDSLSAGSFDPCITIRKGRPPKAPVADAAKTKKNKKKPKNVKKKKKNTNKKATFKRNKAKKLACKGHPDDNLFSAEQIVPKLEDPHSVPESVQEPPQKTLSHFWTE